MSAPAKCKYCGRAGKRWCIKDKEYICSVCCGEKRDLFICPSECAYLKNWIKNIRSELEQLKIREYRALSRDELNDLRQNYDKQVLFQNILLRSIPQGLSITDNDAKSFLEYLREFFRIRKSGLIYNPPFENTKLRLWFDSFTKTREEFEKRGDKLSDNEIFECVRREEKAIQFYLKERFAKNPYLTQLIITLPNIEEKERRIITIG